MKVTLAVCTNRGVKAKTTDSLLKMVAYSKEVDWHILVAEKGYTIAENRNYCVLQAQKNGSDYLLFIDDDMIFNPDTFERLVAHKKDVIGVNSYSRCLPLSSTVGLMDEKGEYMHPDKYPAWQMKIPENLFECYFVGMGIGLINMDVFKELDKPYFAFETYKKGEFKGMVEHGEDGTFCRNLRALGVSIWCDPEVYVGHIGEYSYEAPDEKDNFVEKV